jgi:hypothetical protein
MRKLILAAFLLAAAAAPAQAQLSCGLLAYCPPSGGGPGGGGAWGTITGTLSDQTDLQAELDAKPTITSSASHPSRHRHELPLRERPEQRLDLALPQQHDERVHLVRHLHR